MPSRRPLTGARIETCRSSPCRSTARVKAQVGGAARPRCRQGRSGGCGEWRAADKARASSMSSCIVRSGQADLIRRLTREAPRSQCLRSRIPERLLVLTVAAIPCFGMDCLPCAFALEKHDGAIERGQLVPKQVFVDLADASLVAARRSRDPSPGLVENHPVAVHRRAARGPGVAKLSPAQVKAHPDRHLPMRGRQQLAHGEIGPEFRPAPVAPDREVGGGLGLVPGAARRLKLDLRRGCGQAIDHAGPMGPGG